jgi:isocitrate dehydrogenase
LKEDQRVPDNLSYLGDLCKTPEANIVKLPNVSASVPRLMECISELRSKGYDVPLYPAEPQNAEEKEIQKKYSTILGSAVNPVLREGNSDRRVAAPVKAYAQKNPHRMGMWSKASRTHVAHMTHGDFYESELSVIMQEATDVVIEFTPTSSGEPLVMKASTPLEKGEVIDAAFLSIKALTQFYEDEIEEAKETELLLSLVGSTFNTCKHHSHPNLLTCYSLSLSSLLPSSTTASQSNDDENQ